MKYVISALAVISFGLLVSAGFYFFGSSLTYGAGVTIEGDQIFVQAGGDFQAALDKAKPGDTIYLRAGAEYKGNYVLPVKNGREFITIRSSARDTDLPDTNERIDPARFQKVLPQLISPNNDPVIDTINGSHHFRFVGVAFGGTRDGENNIVRIGSTEESRKEDIPHHIEFDRIYMRATSIKGQRRGIAANGRHITIKNSHISGIRRKGDESQAIAVWAGDGPIIIENNYLEAAAENILFGGAGSRLKLIPSNSIVRGNHLNKPLKWRDEGWLVKNLFEIKNGINIVVENNLMTNNWAKGQDGTAVLFTVREDNDNATIRNIDFRKNVIKGSGNAINIYGSEGAGGHDLRITDNYFLDISGRKWGGKGHFMILTDWKGLTVSNNTIIQTGNITNVYGKPITGFRFENNIVFNNEYGIIGDGRSPGGNTINHFFPGARISRNAIIGGSRSLYGSSNLYPRNKAAIGFSGADYKLPDGNKFKRLGIGVRE